MSTNLIISFKRGHVKNKQMSHKATKRLWSLFASVAGGKPDQTFASKLVDTENFEGFSYLVSFKKFRRVEGAKEE